tara:strand:+ start:372 stop:518 length:147 start_codon:yes stop_codon:yes gene_type:complete
MAWLDKVIERTSVNLFRMYNLQSNTTEIKKGEADYADIAESVDTCGSG